MTWPVILLILFVVVIVVTILLWAWFIRWFNRRDLPRAAEPIEAGSLVYLGVDGQVRNIHPEEWHFRSSVGIAVQDASQNEVVKVMQRGSLPIDKLDLPSSIYKSN